MTIRAAATMTNEEKLELQSLVDWIEVANIRGFAPPTLYGSLPENTDWVGFNTMLNGNESRDYAITL